MKKNKTNKFKTNKFKTNKFKTNKFKTRKYKNRKFAKGLLKNTIKFYLKERLGIYEPKLVAIITNNLKEEELKNLAEDKKNYKKYKNDIQEIEKKIKQKKDNLKKDDDSGIHRASRSRTKQGKQYDREQKVEEIKRLENTMHSCIYKMEILEKKYPNTDLSN